MQQQLFNTEHFSQSFKNSHKNQSNIHIKNVSIASKANVFKCLPKSCAFGFSAVLKATAIVYAHTSTKYFLH